MRSTNRGSLRIVTALQSSVMARLLPIRLGSTTLIVRMSDLNSVFVLASVRRRAVRENGRAIRRFGNQGGSRTMKDVLAVVLAGGKGVAARAADARSGQAGRAVRRHLSDHRFHALQLPQQRRAPDSGAHAVQGDEPRPPHHARLAELSCAASWASSSTSCRRSSGSTSSGTRARPTPCTRTSTRSKKSGREYVVILAGDHIYKMDYGKLIAYHQETNADLTIAALRVKAKEAARQFGIMQVDAEQPRRRLRGKAGRAEDDSRQSGVLPGVDGHLRVQRPLSVRRAVQRRDAAR